MSVFVLCEMIFGVLIVLDSMLLLLLQMLCSLGPLASIPLTTPSTAD